jgi:hypothetical protein
MDALTLIHVVISLVGIATGFVVLYGFLQNDRMDRWNAVFLATTILTSATGYLLPFEKLLPSHIVGAISLVVLAVSLVARYTKKMEGGWRPIYVVTVLTALYLNVFVGVVQAFLKIPALHDLAPKGSEPPFAIAQGLVLLTFIVLTTFSVRRFRNVGRMAAA